VGRAFGVARSLDTIGAVFGLSLAIYLGIGQTDMTVSLFQKMLLMSVPFAWLASILAWLALRGQDRVGLLLFSAGVEHFVPPRKGRGHVMRVIGAILTWSPRERSTNLAAPLEHLSKTLRRKSVCFFVSDFLAPIPSGLLRQTARRHDLTCVRVGPAPEDALCDGGVLMIRDRETGIVREIDTSTRGYRRDVEARILNDAKKFRDVMDQAGAGVLRLDERQDIVDQVAAYLRAGTRGRAR
jgi:uncharacterized protein (DUF58 family)